MVTVGTIFSLGIWTVKPGKEQEFIRAWDDFARWTSENMAGAGSAVLVKDLTDPQKFFSFGPWRDLKDTESWRRTPEFMKSFSIFRELCSDIRPHTLECVVSVGDPSQA